VIGNLNGAVFPFFLSVKHFSLILAQGFPRRNKKGMPAQEEFFPYVGPFFRQAGLMEDDGGPFGTRVSQSKDHGRQGGGAEGAVSTAEG